MYDFLLSFMPLSNSIYISSTTHVGCIILLTLQNYDDLKKTTIVQDDFYRINGSFLI